MEQDTKKHVEEERLEAYAMQSMAEDEAAIVEEHLLLCATCMDRLEEIERYQQAMRGAAKRIREEEVQAPVTPGAWDRLQFKFQKWLRTPLPVFAGVVAMAGIILMVGLEVRQREGPAGAMARLGQPIEVELQATRGASAGTARTGHPLHLHLDTHGVPEKPVWRVEIVDENGSPVWSGSGSRSDNAVIATVEKSLPAATYFVRLVDGGVDPVREYQLVVLKAP